MGDNPAVDRPVDACTPPSCEPSARRARPARVAALGALGGLLVACVFTPPPPLPEELAKTQAEEQARIERLRAGQGDPKAGGETEGGPRFSPGDEPEIGMTDEEIRAYATAQGDPAGGEFTLEQALVDPAPDESLAGEGRLWVRMKLAEGTIECELFPEHAPRTVANFIGLARGKRPFRDEDGSWVTRRYYDGTGFHRVIEGFMIQGGDPTGTGTGNTGYVLPDEFAPVLRHDRAGMLSMANRGLTTGSSQFFVTLAPTPHLDDKHTIFGRCTDGSVAVAERIAQSGGAGDRPRTPQTITKMEIVRAPAGR